ncbi:MAG: DUF3352 domain-containing protein [Chloroflexota bacterium]
MHRLVIALTTLIGLAGAAVIGVYLFLGGVTADRAAGLAPATSAFYATLYLQPSAGQQAQLASVLSRLPGFEDTAALDTKIDELAQRFFGDAGFDYRADVKPWLGNQLAVAGGAPDETGQPRDLLFIADVKDEAVFADRLGSLLPDGTETSDETYQGLTVTQAGTTSYAIVDGMLVAGEAPEQVHGAIDVFQGRVDSLADLPAFSTAMRSLPSDHLLAAWVDIKQMAATAAGTGAVADTAGFSTFSMALLAEESGFRLVGQLPVDAESVGAAIRDALASGATIPQLPDAMPDGTEVSLILHNLRAALERTETELQDQSPDVAATIDQLRALAAFGLGVDIDNDLLPLLDGEVGVALHGIADGLPAGALLLRPSDPAASAEALGRVLDALESRGSAAARTTVAGTEVVSIDVPQVGAVSWAVADELIVLGLTPDDVGAVLEAGAASSTLGGSDLYRSTFAGADRGGTELFIDLNPFVPLFLEQAGEGMPPETADILEHIESFGLTTPSRPDRFEFHATLTIR